MNDCGINVLGYINMQSERPISNAMIRKVCKIQFDNLHHLMQLIFGRSNNNIIFFFLKFLLFVAFQSESRLLQLLPKFIIDSPTKIKFKISWSLTA